MYLLAHTGITLGVAWAIEEAVNYRRESDVPAEGPVDGPVARPPLRVDYRFIVLGALLPDIIDKPLGLILLPGLASGRIFLHTLLFLSLTLLAAVVIYRQQRSPWGFYIAFGVLMHFVMDAIWTEPLTFYWPILGPFKSYPGMTFTWMLQNWIQSLIKESRLYIAETAGFLILLFFTVKLIIQKQVKAFVLHGKL